MGTYESFFRAGKEIVLVSDEMCYSSIFWFDGKNIFSFCRSFGIMKRTDISFTELEKHIDQIKKEGGFVFVRG